MIKAGNLRKKTAAALKKELSRAEIDLWQDYLKLAAGRLKNTSRLRSGRKSLAKILTVLREKEILKGGGDA